MSNLIKIRIDRIAIPLLILVFATSSIFINGYKYGVSDQSITIPFLKKSINNDLYPNDYLMQEKPYYYTYLWPTLALFVKHFKVSIPLLFFICYLVSVYMYFMAIYLIAKTLFLKDNIALLSLFFLLPFKPALAGISTLEGIFLTRVAALPLVLFSIYFFLKSRFVMAFIFQGIAFLIHPITAIFVILMCIVVSLFNIRSIGLKKIVVGFAVLLLFSSPILIWKLLYSPASLKLIYAEPQWVNLLRLRSSSDIFPLSWPKDIFFSEVLLLYILLISYKYKPQANYHRRVLIFMLVIFGLCLMGTIFSEFLPVSIVLNLRLLRSSQFITYFAAIYFANFLFMEIPLRQNIFDKFLVAFAAVGIFYKATLWKYGFVAFLVLCALQILYAWRSNKPFSRHFVLNLFFITLLLMGVGYIKNGLPSIANAQEGRWLDVQNWAKKSTNTAESFLVPPYMEGFRVESERMIFGDWKDGTLMNYDPAFGYEWYERMKRLNYKIDAPVEITFNQLNEKHYISLSQKYGLTFLVTERKDLDFPLVYHNERYFVYELTK